MNPITKMSFICATLTLATVGHASESVRNSTRVNPKLILDKEKTLQFLEDRSLQDYFFSTEGRPSKCPFKTYDQNELVMQLKEVEIVLRNSRCENTQKNFASSLNNMAFLAQNAAMMNLGSKNGATNFAATNDNQLSKPELTPYFLAGKKRIANFESEQSEANAVHLEKIQLQSKQFLQELMEVVSDPDCVNDLSQVGSASALADIARNVGQMSINASGTSDLTMGLGTISSFAFGASFKAVGALLKGPYNWNKEKDRKNFVNLNCNFFDMRKELEAADFFNLNVDRPAKIREGKKYLEIFNAKLAEVKNAKNLYEKHVISTQSEFFGSKIGQKKIELYHLLTKAIDTCTADLEQTLDERYRVTKDLAIITPKMIELIRSEIKTSYSDYLVELLKPFNGPLSALDKMNLKKLSSQYISPVTLYLKTAEEDLESDMLVHMQAYEQQVINEKETNKDVIERGERAFAEITNELVDKRGQLLRRIFLYDGKFRNDIFASLETGAHGDFDVLKEYMESRNLILGKKGSGFLKYLTKSSKNDLFQFLTKFDAWNKKNKDDVYSSDSAKAWSCRDAHQLRVHWNSSFSSISLAHDFYETNKGILSSEVDRFRYTVRFMPFGRSGQFKIYRNLRSLEMAKSIIDKKGEYSRRNVRSSHGRRMNLGEIALLMNEAEPLRQLVDDYFDEHNCLLHL